MAGAEMIVENSKGECNFGQHEINFRYQEVLRTADDHVIFKNGTKEIAAQEGAAITFMAKYDAREGNSCHIHLSLAGEDGGDVFAADEPTFHAFMAGQLACLGELTLLFAPNVNSYKRFAAGSFAPTALAWGRDNRTCALRVVGAGPGLRVENRFAGADVNPYLALAGMIAAGLHGVDEGLELEPAFEGNAYDSDKPHVPGTLRDARDGSRRARWRARPSGRRWSITTSTTHASSWRPTTPRSPIGSSCAASSASEREGPRTRLRGLRRPAGVLGRSRADARHAPCVLGSHVLASSRARRAASWPLAPAAGPSAPATATAGPRRRARRSLGSVRAFPSPRDRPLRRRRARPLG